MNDLDRATGKMKGSSKIKRVVNMLISTFSASKTGISEENCHAKPQK